MCFVDMAVMHLYVDLWAGRQNLCCFDVNRSWSLLCGIKFVHVLVLQILQNHLLIGVWVLITGLQAQLSASSFLAADKGKDDKGKSPNKLREGCSRINLMKVLVFLSIPFMNDLGIWLEI
jgi:hypothetical protein